MSSKAKQAVFFTEDIKEMLECPVCLRVPRKPPIYQCDRGHLLCSECHPKLANCPVCRIHLGQTRSLISEKVLDKVPIACGYYKYGCKMEDVRTAIEEHEQDCPFRVVCCADLACNEEVCMANLLDHMNKEHTKGDFVHTTLNPYKSHFIVNKEDFGREIFWMTDHVTFDGHHFFRQCLRDSSSVWYTWVCMLGSRKECENYSYTVKIYSPDKSRELSFRGKCLPLDTKRDVTNKIGHCLTFTDQIAKTFWACPRLYYFFQLYVKNPTFKPDTKFTSASSSELKRTSSMTSESGNTVKVSSNNGSMKPQTPTAGGQTKPAANLPEASGSLEGPSACADGVIGDMSNMSVSSGGGEDQSPFTGASGDSVLEDHPYPAVVAGEFETDDESHNSGENTVKNEVTCDVDPKESAC